jgi:hypothetical protein
MLECIDLTLSDDDAPSPAPKRARRTHPDSDDGVQIVRRPHAAPPEAMHEQVDEDLVVTNITGKVTAGLGRNWCSAVLCCAGCDACKLGPQVATRDFPHARHVCATHNFSKEASAANAAYCQQVGCSSSQTRVHAFETGSQEHFRRASAAAAAAAAKVQQQYVPTAATHAAVAAAAAQQ